jgi:hypothetical protein
MATKKIIAICQSGGEFQTNKDGVLLYSGGEAYAVDIDPLITHLSDFKQELADNFDSSIDGLVVKYFLPGNKKTLISVSKEKDFKRMVNFYGDSDQIEVFITTETVPTQQVSNLPASRSSRTTESEAVVLSATPTTMIQGDDDVFDMCTTHAAKKSRPRRTTLATHPINTVGEIMPAGTEQFNVAEWQNTITGVGQTFSSFAEFREAVRKYSIAHGFNYSYKKNETHRVTVVCKSENCPWRIHVSRLATTHLVCIKTMRPTHTCEGDTVKPAYRATRSWVGSIIREKLRVSPNYKPKEIANDFKNEYGIELNYSQAWRAKEKARELLQGSYKEAYNQLPFFCENIIQANPGSHATFTTKEDATFHRLFISFHASISGFQQGCRPLVFLDSTAVNSKYQGFLLAATAADGDDGVFPVAFAIVDELNDDNWRWFLSQLKSALSTTRRITFVSDFQRGIKESLTELYGDSCHHAFCLWYLAEKLNIDLKGQFSHEARHLIVQDLYAAAYAPKLEHFEKSAANIKAISPEAYNWVINSGPSHWANAFFEGTRYNHMTSNFGQLFYSWVADSTELPMTITQIVDLLRGKIMELMYAGKVNSSQWDTKLTPSMEEKIKNETLKARCFTVLPIHGSSNTFEITGGESNEIVDFAHFNCSCKEWQIYGLPCCHSISVFQYLDKNPYDCCQSYFSLEFYSLTYAENINPVPTVERDLKFENDEGMIITPPPVKRVAGRPKMKQAGSVEIIRRQLQCGRCKVIGHNKRSCKFSPGTEQLTGENILSTVEIAGQLNGL